VAPEIRTVGVVGAGTMGAGIAQLAVEAGQDVRLHDLDEDALARATTRVRDGLARRAAALGLDADAIDDWVEGRLARLRPAASLAELAAESQVVIEAALEDLAVKREIFGALDGAAAPDTILATNTSALSVAAIGARTRHPGRVLGLHFFNPAPLMRLVEVVVAPATDPACAREATALMERWGRTPVRSADSPGFIVNRVNRPFTLEPLAALEAGGTSARAIDRAIRDAGYPMGPFELMDLIGIDVNLAVANALYAASVAAGDPLAERFRPSALQERLVAAGRFGRKTATGFHDYGAGDGVASAEAAPDAVDAVDPALVERVRLAIANEAYRALGDGVATRDAIDLALRLGAGHPAGPFEWVEGVGGPATVLERLRALAGAGPRFEPAPALVVAAHP
jgi:3-hydroxybutyryl-CoA dehydrogenase